MRAHVPSRARVDLDARWSELGWPDELLVALEREFGVAFPVAQLLGITVGDTLAYLRRFEERG